MFRKKDLTDSVNKAVATATGNVNRINAEFNAQRAKLLKQLTQLDLKQNTALTDCIKQACEMHRAPFLTVQHAVLANTVTPDPRRALGNAQVAAIRGALASGVKGSVLARQYGVSPMLISRIRGNKTYKT